MKITQVLLEKIFHEISGSISGIKLGTEYLYHDNPEMRKEAEAILLCASETLCKKFIFLKTMYCTDNQDIHIHDMEKLIKSYLSSNNISFCTKNVCSDASLRVHIKLILSVIYLLYEDNLLSKIKISYTKYNTTIYFSYTATPSKSIQLLDNALQFNMSTAVEEVSLSNINLYYLKYYIMNLQDSYKVRTNSKDKEITFSIIKQK